MFLNRFFALSVALFSVCFTLGAQPSFPIHKSYKADLERMQVKIDSLQAIIDSLTQEQEEEVVIPMTDYHEASLDLEVTDSLLGAWYRNTQIQDYILDENESLDSLKFTSNIPDSVLIKRIEAINSYIQIPFNQTVKNYVIMYSEKMPTAMGRALGRSQYYMPIFEETFARYNMPLELKYMAIIESMLNPVAESRAGARGMWQFMYQTGRRYGLKINSFVDERLDVEKAVDAAARYLLDAYQTFGDWNLAISSYNCGAGNVNKAIHRSGGKRDFWSIYDFLPRETRGYVPAFVGAMYAMTYYREYGIVPSEQVVKEPVDTFMITHNLHFKQINEVVGIPMETLSELNPQYLHQIIPGTEEPCVLKVPLTWTNSFIDVDQDSLYNHRSEELMSAQVIKNIQESGNEVRTAYRVKSGDYLGRIASKYHVTVKQLMKWNHLKNSNLRVGQVLYIYHNGAVPDSSAATSSSSPSASASASASSSSPSVYTVKSGDTLYGIAKNYPGISAQDIMNFNGLSSTALKPGMKLKIPAK